MTSTFAIFNQKFDCEIWVNLKLGDRESIDTIRELIKYELDANDSIEGGYVESYPFFQANWKIVGGRMGRPFDFDQVLEVENDWGAFDEE
jgi:hypothetical protein